MRPGKLRHRITIQRMVETRNATGGITQTWEDYATLWAAVEPLRGQEFWAGTKEQQARVTTRIRIRYREDITPKMRVSFLNKVYDIRYLIDVEERHREMQLMCEEWVAT